MRASGRTRLTAVVRSFPCTPGVIEPREQEGGTGPDCPAEGIRGLAARLCGTAADGLPVGALQARDLKLFLVVAPTPRQGGALFYCRRRHASDTT